MDAPAPSTAPRGSRAGLTAMLLVVVLCALPVAACSPGASPSPTPWITPTPTVIPAADLDPGLETPLEQLLANPSWTGGSVGPLAVREVAISADGLCLEVTAPDVEPLVVAVDVVPAVWRITATGRYDEDEAGETQPFDLYTAFERDTFESCHMVLAGPWWPWPDSADGIDVAGGSGYPLDKAMIPPLREALFADPEAFGLERVGRPALSLGPEQDCSSGTCVYLDEPSAGLVCLDGAASYGAGAVAGVAVGLREEPDGWEVVSVRLVHQALADIEERDPSGC